MNSTWNTETDIPVFILFEELFHEIFKLTLGHADTKINSNSSDSEVKLNKMKQGVVMKQGT